MLKKVKHNTVLIPFVVPKSRSYFNISNHFKLPLALEVLLEVF